MKKGQLGVQTENLLPIIKKYLYSDQEIFLRELISNAVDATQKLQTLVRSGAYDEEVKDTRIEVEVDQKQGKIHVKDKGVGMSEKELEKYINEIAFSSAGDFVEKYKDKDPANIIGHFGLGFYSAFMVADKVEIDTRSYKKDVPAVLWSCTGDTEFEIKRSKRKSRGTKVTLHVSDDAKEYLEPSRIRELLQKYCRFVPVEVAFENEVINDTKPIWLKNPSELTSQNYQDFYNKLYPLSQPPLFWIHLNVDYPFKLTGVLYFPKITTNIEVQRNKIRLYCNQVYVTDNVGDIVPEFLTLLHGVIDSPDIPLNISRSYLQNDSNVKKISNYIVRKVAEKLKNIFKDNRKDYEEKWNDISVFIKYGILTNEKFKEKATDFLLLGNVDNRYFTISEYKEKVKENQTDKNGKIVFLYTNDEKSQHTYIEAARKREYDILKFDHPIDTHFLQHLEQMDEKVSIKRVDSETIDNLIDKGEEKESALSKDQQDKLKKVYEEVANKDTYKLETEALSPDDPPLVITQGEMERRMKEMSELSGMSHMGNLPDQITARINTNHKLASRILLAKNKTQQKKLAQQAFDLARLSKGMLKGEDLGEFIKRSLNLIE